MKLFPFTIIMLISVNICADNTNMPIGKFITNTAFYGKSPEDECFLVIDNEKIKVGVGNKIESISYSIIKISSHSIFINVSGELTQCFKPKDKYWRIDFASFMSCKFGNSNCPFAFSDNREFDLITYNSIEDASNYKDSYNWTSYHNGYK